MTSIHSVAVTIEDSTTHRHSNVPILHEKEEKSRVKQWIQRQWKEIFYEPRGVRVRHYFIVKWLGRIGFIAKGIVYAVMGGLCIRTAQQLVGDITGSESPMVRFVYKKKKKKKARLTHSHLGSVCIFRHVLNRHTYSHHYVYRTLVLLDVEIVSLLLLCMFLQITFAHYYFE